MTTKRAIEVLKWHNAWRRGDEYLQMPNPGEVGKAIDKAVEVMKSVISKHGSNPKK